MVNNKKNLESTLSLKDVYFEACKMIYKNDVDQIATNDNLNSRLEEHMNGFDKRKQKLTKTFPLDLNRLFSKPDNNGYAFPELTALLFAAYLTEDQRSGSFASKIFQKEKIAKINLTEKQQFMSKVIDRLESRHKEQEDYSFINQDIDAIKASYENHNRYEQDLKNRIEQIKTDLTRQIDDRLKNVGASIGLNQFIFDSTIDKIKRKDFSINDFFDIAKTNDMDTVGLTEIFEKDAAGRLMMNHSETKMQLTRDDRLKVIDKFEEFLTDAMDNWTVYLEEFERNRHEEYHRKFQENCTRSNDYEVLSFSLPRTIVSDNLGSSEDSLLMNLQYYSSIQETDSGLIANIQLETGELETTEAVDQKVMIDYNLMLYDFLVNTDTAVSAKHYDDIINFDNDGHTYANYLELKQSKITKSPPSEEEMNKYVEISTNTGEVFYQPLQTSEEMREDYFLLKKHLEEHQMYIDNLQYRSHIGDQEAHEKLSQLIAKDLEVLSHLQEAFKYTHFGEYYALSKKIRSDCQEYIQKKLQFKEKLNKAMAKIMPMK